jgi:transposase
MDAIVQSCAGLDVHQKTVVACVLYGPLEEKPKGEMKSFGTTTGELLELADWLRDKEVSVVAMESTGIYWRPVWNVLEGNGYELVLANARKVKNVAGRKTDQRDAEWLAQLLRCGLVEKSFVPNVEQRDLRDLTRRRRKLLQDITQEKNRVHKMLQDANIKLTSVVSDLFGVSGRALLAALTERRDISPELVSAVVKGKLVKKVPELNDALVGRVRPHHRKMIAYSLEHIQFLEKQVKALEEEIDHMIEPFRVEVELLCTIPGIEKPVAAEIVAEIGTDMSIFPSEQQLANWIGVAPGNFESAGKSKGGRTPKGNRYIKSSLVQCAWAASRTKDTRLSGRFWRLARRLGRDARKKALVATAHTLVSIIYYVLSTGNPYQEFGPSYGARSAADREQYLARELQKLGYSVTKKAA